MNCSGAPIIILDTDDVVLAEITAGLNLDQFQQNLAGIFQPVDRADRDIDRLVLVHGLDEFIDRSRLIGASADEELRLCRQSAGTASWRRRGHQTRWGNQRSPRQPSLRRRGRLVG
jgi:hypothetical protein